MKINAGLWIDHREAIIVVLTNTGEETTHIQSNAEHGASESEQIPADDSRQRASTGHLAHYYDKVISELSRAEAVLILGPGEAKGELKKRWEKHPSSSPTITVETTDKMTEPQIVARVRHHFHHDPIRQ